MHETIYDSSIIGSRLCLLDKLILFLARLVNLEQHRIISSLFPDNLALHVVHPGSGDGHHAAAEQYLRQEDRYEDVRVLRQVVLITLLSLVALLSIIG